ncbi:MAG TPA: VOC family protein [Solirubrobacteraceae bacterium]
MKIRPIQFVSELPSALAFYEALGLSAEVRSRTGNWIELKASAGELGLHDGPGAADGEGRQGFFLAFVADEPLEKVAARLRLAGFPPEGDVVDREWGRSLLVRGPDGEIVQIDEQDPELYV